MNGAFMIVATNTSSPACAIVVEAAKGAGTCPGRRQILSALGIESDACMSRPNGAASVRVRFEANSVRALGIVSRASCDASAPPQSRVVEAETCEDMLDAVLPTVAAFVDESDCVALAQSSHTEEKEKKETVERERDALATRNLVFAELGGASLGASLSYERLLFSRTIGVRAGIGVLPGSEESASRTATVPTSISAYFGGKEHRGLVGVGATWTTLDFRPLPSLSIGYRYTPREPGPTFGVAFTPIFVPFPEALAIRALYGWPIFVLPFAGINAGLDF